MAGWVGGWVGELGATRVGGVTQLRFNCVDEIVTIGMNFFFSIPRWVGYHPIYNGMRWGIERTMQKGICQSVSSTDDLLTDDPLTLFKVRSGNHPCWSDFTWRKTMEACGCNPRWMDVIPDGKLQAQKP